VAVDHLPPPGPSSPTCLDEPFRLPEAPSCPRRCPSPASTGCTSTGSRSAPRAGRGRRVQPGGPRRHGRGRQTADASLALRRTDEATASLDLAAEARPRPRAGSGISLKGDETGGLLATATGRPEAGPLRLSLEGDGPLDDWRGRLLVDAERLARLETTLDLAYASTRRVRVDGTFTAAPGVLPANIAPVVGERVTLALHAGETGPGLFALERLLSRPAP
jgi:hypothetical protein